MTSDMDRRCTSDNGGGGSVWTHCGVCVEMAANIGLANSASERQADLIFGGSFLGTIQ